MQSLVHDILTTIVNVCKKSLILKGIRIGLALDITLSIFLVEICEKMRFYDNGHTVSFFVIPQPTISNKDACLQDFLLILKQMLQNK